MRTKITILLFLALYSFGYAAAETGPRKDIFKMPLEELLQLKVAEVTTASKQLERSAQAPGMVVVIDERDIRLRGYSTLTDVLRDLPGMELIEYYQSEFGTYVAVRGLLGNNKIILLVNGVRVNPPGGEELPIRSDISVRFAEQIEIVYGPGSTLYGQDAISAVINIKTRQPAKAREGEVALAYGNNDAREGWVNFGSLFGRDNECRFSGYLQYHNSKLSSLDKDYPDYWRNYIEAAEPRGRGADPVREDYGLNAFARLELSDFSLQLWHRDSRRSSSEGINSRIFPFVDEAVWQDASTTVEGRHDYEISDRTALSSSLLFNRYEIDPQSRYVFPSSATAWDFTDFKYGIGTSYALEETLNMQVTDRLRLLAGIALSTYDILPKVSVPGGANTDGDIVSQAGNIIYYDENGQQLVPRAVNVNYETYGAYCEASWQKSDDLKAIAGVRYDFNTHTEESSISPRLALVYNLTELLTAKYSYASAYISPAPYFSLAPFANAIRVSVPNPDLEPETADSHELNLIYQKTALQLGASAYYGEQHNLLRTDRQETLKESVFLDAARTQERVLTQLVNAGSSKNYGVDLYGQATFADFSSWFSYSYMDYEEEGDGITLGLKNLSHHQVRAGIVWAGISKLFVTPSLVLRSTPAGSLEDESDTPWEINLHSIYAYSEHIEFFATFRNLTNNKNMLTNAGREAKPQETFSAMGGVRARF